MHIIIYNESRFDKHLENMRLFGSPLSIPFWYISKKVSDERVKVSLRVAGAVFNTTIINFFIIWEVTNLILNQCNKMLLDSVLPNLNLSSKAAIIGAGISVLFSALLFTSLFFIEKKRIKDHDKDECDECSKLLISSIYEDIKKYIRHFNKEHHKKTDVAGLFPNGWIEIKDQMFPSVNNIVSNEGFSRLSANKEFIANFWYKFGEYKKEPCCNVKARNEKLKILADYIYDECTRQSHDSIEKQNRATNRTLLEVTKDFDYYTNPLGLLINCCIIPLTEAQLRSIIDTIEYVEDFNDWFEYSKLNYK